MVNNIFNILNEKQKILSLNYKEYNMKSKDLYRLCLSKSKRLTTEREFNADICDYEENVVSNNDYKEPPPRITYGMKVVHEWEIDLFDSVAQGIKGIDLSIEKYNKKFITAVGDENLIWEYLGIEKFTPSVMINISPDWDGDIMDKNGDEYGDGIIEDFTSCIEGYLGEGNRYDYYSYVIECGGEGTHLHAHIVAHINPRIGKSVEKHLAKGNHTIQIRKRANKLKGMEGTIKGVGIQKVFLRNETLVKDKLDYLVEDLKPDGHKNKYVIGKGRVDKILFTVK